MAIRFLEKSVPTLMSVHGRPKPARFPLKAHTMTLIHYCLQHDEISLHVSIFGDDLRVMMQSPWLGAHGSRRVLSKSLPCSKEIS